jgi:glucose/arabinose dehydrogenase
MASGRRSHRQHLGPLRFGLPLVAAALTATACSASSPSSSSTPGNGAAPASATGSSTAPASTAGPGSASPSGSVASPAAARVQVRLGVPSGEGGGQLSTPRTLSVPPGWTATVWARVPGARMEAWTPQGDLLVSQPGSGSVSELRPGTSGTATQATVLSGLTNPQGLAFARLDGREVLYVGESDQIDRYPWGASGISGSRTVIAANLPDASSAGDDVHREKTVTVAPDGTVYFNVGSANNANPVDRTSSPQRAVIEAVSPQGQDLHVVEKGVRNGEGLAVAPDGSVWTAVNNRDNITYPFRSAYDGDRDPFGQVIQGYVNEHPADEVVPVTAGRDLGWPYCNPDQDLNSPAGSMASVPFVADAVTNPGQDHLKCSALPRLQVGLPAHSAPLGMSFLEKSSIAAPWSGGAVVAVHGSWDRRPPRAPAVVWMAWDAGRHTLMPAVTLVGGFQSSSGSRWGRPVDAVPGPDGALYVSDDLAGAIYRLVPAK